MAYAENTSVSAERSRAEIETTLKRYGADSFGYMTDARRAQIGFQCQGRLIQISIAIPDGSQLKAKTGKWAREVTDVQRAAWVEQENRRRWRALNLVIKAKLEAVASGISTMEMEFLAFTVLPDGKTVGDWMHPQLEQIQASGKMPRLLGVGS